MGHSVPSSKVVPSLRYGSRKAQLQTFHRALIPRQGFCIQADSAFGFYTGLGSVHLHYVTDLIGEAVA
jgi:hypothetical protein